VPDYYHTTYTGCYRPRGKEEVKGEKEGKEATVGEAFDSPTKPVEAKVEETKPPVEQDRIEIEIGGGDYQGGGTFKNPEQKAWYNDQISQRMNKGMSHEEAIQDYRNTFKIGPQNKNLAIIEGEKGKFKRTQ